MPRERFVSGPSEKGRKYFLIVYAVATLCFSQAALAQSGRRPDKSVPPPQPPVIAQPAINSQTIKPAVHISSVMVVGHILHNYTYFHSDYLDAALKECMNMLKQRPPSVLVSTKGGSMTFNEAKEQAKKETDTHVLWIEFVTKDDGYGTMSVDYILYALLTPQTAKRIASDRFYPGHPSVLTRGGDVLRLPSRQGSTLSQMRNGAREVADRLMSGGWL